MEPEQFEPVKPWILQAALLNPMALAARSRTVLSCMLRFSRRYKRCKMDWLMEVVLVSPKSVVYDDEGESCLSNPREGWFRALISKSLWAAIYTGYLIMGFDVCEKFPSNK